MLVFLICYLSPRYPNMTFATLKDKLSFVGSSEPRSEALLLLRSFFGVSPSSTLLHPDWDYDDEVLEAAVLKRADGYPLQYIIGEVCFYGAKIRVTPDCLIPRPETEQLCEYLAHFLPERAHVLELCTGSGCIPISILKARNDITCRSVELLASTVKLARENRDLNGISPDRLEIECADALKIDPYTRLGMYNVIISNPPYIRTDEINDLSAEVLHEPRVALDGGNDGLVFYRKFLTSYSPMLKPDGYFAFEIGHDQGEAIMSLSNELGFACRVEKDFSRNDRFAFVLI